MNIAPWLGERMPALAVPLGSAGGHVITGATILALTVGLLLTLGLGSAVARGIHTRLGREEDASPHVQRLGAELARWPIVLAGIAVTLDVAELAGVRISLVTAVTVVVILAVTWWLSAVAQRGVRRVAQKGVPGTSTGTIGVAERLVHYLILAIGGTIAFQAVGIDLSTMFAAGAVFAVGVGFAMQEIAQNFVSGVILLVEGVIRPGDIIEVDGRVVRVTRMGIRSTVVRTRDDEDMIVPHTLIAQSTVKNLTMTDDQLRLRVSVGVSYDSDLKIVIEALREVASAFSPRVDHEPVVLLTGFGASSVDFEVWVWIRDPWIVRLRQSELLLAIWWALRERGVVIAYPQVDVHLDRSVITALTADNAPR